MKYKGGELNPQKEEIEAAGWVPAEEVLDKLSFDKDKKIYNIAMQKLQKLKVHA
jgi:8-oxo-dGTP diphosphatase